MILAGVHDARAGPRARPCQIRHEGARAATPLFRDLDWQELVGVLVRLGIAALLGAAVGWERERRRRNAGLRTHILVAVGAAAFMLVALSLSESFAHADPVRMAQGIAIGIGFVGGGAILKLPAQDRVEGLTTAGSVWATSAAGLAIGTGKLILAVVLTLLTVIVLSTLRRLEKAEGTR